MAQHQLVRQDAAAAAEGPRRRRLPAVDLQRRRRQARRDARHPGPGPRLGRRLRDPLAPRDLLRRLRRP
ncbi:hypothetical protein VTK73DRAFT_2947 [Phialemonium thermophilum]|uniref:Uncharacterized protein n=1 Tax=Phialemonium thermophilum TaxID=223376 RepID=A0ABR3VMW7_9PEZI